MTKEKLNTFLRRMGHCLMGFSFVREAVEGKADLSAFREKPGPRIILGLSLILFSYVIGWPLITLAAIAAALYREPLLIVVGGPLTYGISHLTLMLGVYLAGARHSKIFLQWATRRAVEKMLFPEGDGKRRKDDTMNDN